MPHLFLRLVPCFCTSQPLLTHFLSLGAPFFRCCLFFHASGLDLSVDHQLETNLSFLFPLWFAVWGHKCPHHIHSQSIIYGYKSHPETENECLEGRYSLCMWWVNSKWPGLSLWARLIDFYCQVWLTFMKCRSRPRQRPDIGLSFINLLCSSSFQLGHFFKHLGSLKMPLPTLENSDVLGRRCNLGIKICSVSWGTRMCS